MARLCIPQETSKRLLSALKAGEFSIGALTEMTSEQRNKLFKKYMRKDEAQMVNGLFERALVSPQKQALKNWAERVLTGDRQGPKYKNVMRKIQQLDEVGMLNPESSDSFLRDLVAEKLGVTVTAEEAKNISALTKELETLDTADKFGLPTLAYLKKRRELNEYLASIEPTPQLRILTSTIARGNLLFSIKSPMTNIIGNTVIGLQESFVRRMAERRFAGSNPDLALEYVNYAVRIYRETGYDITRTIHLDDTMRTLGEDNTSAQGPGTVRKIGRFYEDFVFKGLMSTPDVAFSAIHFADSANIAASKIADREGLKGTKAKERARAIMTDAFSFDPLTDEGVLVRQQAMADALYATFQNDSYYSTFALAIRTILNQASGDVRLGDQLMPFVKTPANVIGAGVDAAGLGAIRGLYNLRGALEAASIGDAQPLRNVIRDVTRSGLGFTLAFILASMFEPEDYIGEYPTSSKEQELLRLQNATTNSIRIGDKWISLDYFGAIAAPLVGIMYARKYGNGVLDASVMYAKGVGAQVLKIPSFEGLYDLMKSAKESVVAAEGASPNETAVSMLKGAYATMTEFISARVIPAVVYDFAKAADEYERATDKESVKDKIINRLPVLRETLPVRLDTFGNAIKTEPGVSQFLFGSRVKTAPESAVVAELERLSGTGNLPSIADVEKTSTRVKEMKKTNPERYDAMLTMFKEDFRMKTERLITSNRYNRLDDEQKAKAIEEIRADALDRALARNGYRPGGR